MLFFQKGEAYYGYLGNISCCQCFPSPKYTPVLTYGISGEAIDLQCCCRASEKYKKRKTSPTEKSAQNWIFFSPEQFAILEIFANHFLPAFLVSRAQFSHGLLSHKYKTDINIAAHLVSSILCDFIFKTNYFHVPKNLIRQL